VRAARADRPMRAVVVSPFGTSAVTGGAEKWLSGMLAAAPDIQWRVLLLQPGPFREELGAAGIDVEVHPTGPSGIEVARAARQVAALLGRLQPDVVVGNGVKAQLVTAPGTLLHNVPSVWVKHDYSFDRTLARPLGLVADAVVTTAEEVGTAVRRRDLVVIHPPAQPRRPSDRESARRRLAGLGLGLDDRPTLVMAGRLVPYKGIDDAITALSLPPAAPWRLVVIGDEDHSALGEQHRLAGLAARLGVTSRVTFVPPVRGLPDLFAAFDALAVLTKPTGRRTPGREGFGMTAFEAMQAGIPVVAAADSPVARRIAGGAGVTVAAGAPRDVAAALGLLADPSLRLSMGESGREVVAGYPGAEEAARAFVTVLRSTAERAGTPRRRGWARRLRAQAVLPRGERPARATGR
jgi:glycosyltransferase involved in cell wall biosynthesis